ncbi:outer membrane receptor protein [Bernardetia litoralis DSM 6794]|uniref:Outer membrane receptor protein n=1 Tax=Bernardetia litoralis (strain ATCC 23117 / DSM 6794 / NBRC 15988 / NCIMB 1366 / Fx l1 / Sio-4) TaxID=880071 RepID=I4ALK0_BERLS|nr:outer membrane receptor protein [Bernardetia litoralis DSM 6794]
MSAQTITGIVTDQYQKPLQEVNILNKKTDNHTHSDAQGNFVFEKISIGDTLLFSHVGFQDKLLVVSDLKTPLNIVLIIKSISLDEIVIKPQINTLQLITDIDIQTNPVNSSQDILRKVPGLFIGQHAGGGKAEQIFLRGFDIDHGTDISISVDGLPVNMVSHAHGQGYSDLHFVIPETIEKVDFGKGVYYEDKGNFTTAGYVDFNTKQKLDYNSIKLEVGQFDTYRALGMFNLINDEKNSAYIATEFQSSDGAFESPQNFNRINIFGKYTGLISETDKISITASHFTSKWDASGQIPQRAVDSGLISRFGSIDDTEGGTTSRSNLKIDYDKWISKNGSLKSSVYLSQYDFELFSNFTFFLEDPINGDQIKQKENRIIYGLNTEYNEAFSTKNINGNWKLGVSLRNDQTDDTELSHTLNRTEVLEQIKLGDINETNLGAYIATEININKWTFNPSLRVDYFDFQYNDALLPTYKTQEETKAIVSPKFNILYNQSQKLQLYLKTGKGFHSNDTRVVVAEEGKEILPAAYGFDAGFIWKPTPKMLFNLAYWYLYLEQEFVYVGDAGVVEPSGKTQRQGIDLSYRYQPLPWLFWSFDANYTYARSIDEPKEMDYIPLAPDFTLVSGLNIIHKSGIYGSINMRYLDNRPANEDNSIVAEGYTVFDLNAGYKWKKFNFGIQIQNLFDTQWNETQFATESQLQYETESVEEITFTPGTPFFLKTSIQFNF